MGGVTAPFCERGGPLKAKQCFGQMKWLNGVNEVVVCSHTDNDIGTVKDVRLGLRSVEE